MARSTRREIRLLRKNLADIAGGEAAASAALTKARYLLPPSVTLGCYSDGEWSMSWLEGNKTEVRHRKVRVMVDEILSPGELVRLYESKVRA